MTKEQEAKNLLMDHTCMNCAKDCKLEPNAEHVKTCLFWKKSDVSIDYNKFKNSKSIQDLKQTVYEILENSRMR